MAYVPGYVIYVLYYLVRTGAIFYWVQVILNEISHKLFTFIQTKRFYMTSYLVLALAHCNKFEGMPPKGSVNFEQDPIQFWYPPIWKHKAPFLFYQIHDSFVKECRAMLIGTEPTRFT